MNMARFAASLVAVLAVPVSARAQQTMPAPPPPGPPMALGGAGESCRARTDCKQSLKCVNQVCRDEREGQSCAATSDCGVELRCVERTCTSATSARGSRGLDFDTNDWMKFKLEGTHPFFGLTFAGGFMTKGITGNFAGAVKSFDFFDGAFLFALHGGVFIDKEQLELEISPFTYVWDGKANGPIFQMTANYAHFFQLYDSNDLRIYWPIRIGLGMSAGDNILGLATFQPRADLIGVALQVGHAIIDLHLPTFRYAVTDKNGTQLHVLDWMFGTSISYAL